MFLNPHEALPIRLAGALDWGKELKILEMARIHVNASRNPLYPFGFPLRFFMSASGDSSS